MRGHIKVFSMLLLVLASIFMVSPVKANDEPFEITAVEVCDIVADKDQTEAVYVERGTSCNVEIYLLGNDNTDDVKIKAWVGGYEYDDIEDVSEMFDVKSGVKYKKYLRLDFPEDMDTSKSLDHGDDYTLYVEVYNKDFRIDEDYTLRVEDTRHLVAIRDVIVRPGNYVEAGRALFTVVRVENMGARKEEDIKVVVSIPELGISTRDYVDELTDLEINNEDEEDSMSSNELFLRIPSDAKTGDYEMLVEVVYNRGHSVSRAKEMIHVVGAESEEAQDEGTYLVNFDATSKEVNLGDEAAFKVRIANLNGEAHVYSVEVSGEKLFANSRVENNFVRIAKDSTGEITLFMSGKQAGSNSFTVKVMTDGKLLEERTLTLNVKGDVLDTRNVLLIGFVVLVIILIVLGLIVAFSKMRTGDEEEGYY